MDRTDIDAPARGGDSTVARGRAVARTPARRLPLATLDVPLERDLFLRTLLRELAGTLQDVVGLDEASGS
jgi:hypothetical protein